MADFKQYTSSELTGHFQTPLPLFMGHGLMDDLLEVVSTETNEFWHSRKTADSVGEVRGEQF
jgi:hypothetical protein